MNNNENLVIPSLMGIKQLIEPLFERLERIENGIKHKPNSTDKIKYFRNQDLKEIFGLSNNTIIKYRETGVLPYTKLGDIYLYEKATIERILNDNKITI